MYELRLASGELRSAPFIASADSLKPRLHTAFIAFTAAHGVRSAVLQVRHRIHGWHQVCARDDELHISHFQIIRNPLLLDYKRLTFSISHTLAECDRWPTAEEKKEIIAKRLARQREEIAKARRRSFRVV